MVTLALFSLINSLTTSLPRRPVAPDTTIVFFIDDDDDDDDIFK
jgi:hypothetical protein